MLVLYMQTPILKELRKHLAYLIESNPEGEDLNIDSIRDYIINSSNILGLNVGGNESKSVQSHYLGNNKLLVKVDFGWVCINTHNLDVATGVVKDGIIEPWNGQILEEILKPGDTFINVGANFGYFTLKGASIVGRGGKVLAFEANPMIYDCLMTGIFYSGFPEIVDAYNFAASDVEKELRFNFNPLFSGAGSLISQKKVRGINSIRDTYEDCLVINAEGFYERFVDGDWERRPQLSIQTRSKLVDQIFKGPDYDISKLSLIQIDVEGAESMVINGLRKTIRAVRPNLLIEFNPITLGKGLNELDNTSVISSFKFLFEEMDYEAYRVIPEMPYGLERIEGVHHLSRLPHCDILFSSTN